MTATALVPAPVEAPVNCNDTIAEHADALMGDADWLTIAEVAERTGVTAHTLRYYERVELIAVPRDSAGRRRYARAEVGRVVFITRLRLTAMPIRAMQQYFRLVDEGPSTVPDRLGILQHQREEVVGRLRDLQLALDAIDFKLNLYRTAVAA